MPALETHGARRIESGSQAQGWRSVSASPKTKASKSGFGVRLVPLKNNAHRPPRELPLVVSMIGSGEGCDVILSSSNVDAAHTAIARMAGGTYICDLGAPGGTKLNGKPIRWARANDGDEIGVGPFEFLMELERKGDSDAAHPPVFSLRNDQTIGAVKCIDPVLVIGSDPGCDVVLEEECILARHCIVVWTSDGAVVRDMSGRDLTRVNGQRVHTARLRDGDAIGIGPHELLFEVDVNDVPKAPALSSLGGNSMAEDAILGDGLSSIVAGRLAKGQINRLEELWPSRGSKPASTLGAGSLPKTTPNNEKHAKAGQNGGSQKPTAMDGNGRVESSPVELIRGKKDELRQRVAAAQGALDERAKKIRDEIERERAQLEARKKTLQRQARVMLQAAHEKKLKYVQGGDESVEASDVIEAGEIEIDARDNMVPSDGLPPEVVELLEEERRIDQLLSGHVELMNDADFNMRETGLAASIPLGDALDDSLTTLEEKVAELIRVADAERKEMERGEQMVETLRFETERQRSALTRRHQKLQSREAALEKRFRSLTRSREAIRKERTPLLARLRELDTEDAVIRSRMTESERLHQEMITEAEQIDETQERLETRERELLHKLEIERQRLQRRQTELRRKASKLVKAAREKRIKIEHDVAGRQAELEAREAELRARRMELEEAARGELQRTATELESVLNVRLGDIEADLMSRSADLEQRVQKLSGLGEATRSISRRDGTTMEDPLRKMAAELSTYRMVEEGLGADGSKLDSIEDEIKSFGRSVGSANDGDGIPLCDEVEADEPAPDSTGEFEPVSTAGKETAAET